MEAFYCFDSGQCMSCPLIWEKNHLINWEELSCALGNIMWLNCFLLFNYMDDLNVDVFASFVLTCPLILLLFVFLSGWEEPVVWVSVAESSVYEGLHESGILCIMHTCHPRIPLYWLIGTLLPFLLGCLFPYLRFFCWFVHVTRPSRKQLWRELL